MLTFQPAEESGRDSYCVAPDRHPSRFRSTCSSKPRAAISNKPQQVTASNKQQATSNKQRWWWQQQQMDFSRGSRRTRHAAANAAHAAGNANAAPAAGPASGPNPSASPADHGHIHDRLHEALSPHGLLAAPTAVPTAPAAPGRRGAPAAAMVVTPDAPPPPPHRTPDMPVPIGQLRRAPPPNPFRLYRSESPTIIPFFFSCFYLFPNPPLRFIVLCSRSFSCYCGTVPV